MLLLPVLQQVTPAVSLLPSSLVWHAQTEPATVEANPSGSSGEGTRGQLADGGIAEDLRGERGTWRCLDRQHTDLTCAIHRPRRTPQTCPACIARTPRGSRSVLRAAQNEANGQAADVGNQVASAGTRIRRSAGSAEWLRPLFDWRGAAARAIGDRLLGSASPGTAQTEIPRPLGCRARVAASEAVRVPVTLGLLRPVILLPADWHRWSEALLASVVMHEQAHINRRDHAVLLVSELNRCLYWFHPVAWFLHRRLSALAEQCCDDTVIAALQSRSDYAQHLLEIAERLVAAPGRVAPVGISMARTSNVESRIVAILDEHRPLAGRMGRRGALALVALVGPVVLLAAGLRTADPPALKPLDPAARPAATTAPEPAAQAEADKPPVKGATVSGRVVLEADDSPVAGAEVRLLLNDAEGYRESERDVASDEQGNFLFQDVPDGAHRLVAVTANIGFAHAQDQRRLDESRGGRGSRAGGLKTFAGAVNQGTRHE